MNALGVEFGFWNATVCRRREEIGLCLKGSEEHWEGITHTRCTDRAFFTEEPDTAVTPVAYLHCEQKTQTIPEMSSLNQ